MNKFKVLVSQHSDEKGRVYNVGDVVTTMQDLDLQFGANKFERLGASAPAAKPAAPASQPKEGGGRVDVSADFFAAEEAGLKVFQVGDAFDVCEPDSDTPLNGEPLDKPGVEKLLAEFVEPVAKKKKGTK